MSYSNVSNPANYQLQALGQKGFRKINSSFVTVSGEYYRAFIVVADAVVTATSESGDNLSFETLLTGTVIYGLFSSIVVESGAVIAYIA
jgi:hypothetical protein